MKVFQFLKSFYFLNTLALVSVLLFSWFTQPNCKSFLEGDTNGGFIFVKLILSVLLLCVDFFFIFSHTFIKQAENKKLLSFFFFIQIVLILSLILVKNETHLPSCKITIPNIILK